MKGECLACARIGECSETSVEKTLRSHTCPLFEQVPGPVYAARVSMMQVYGDESAVNAMLNRPSLPADEREE